jgi:YesN/AraC family two-component response regulator
MNNIKINSCNITYCDHSWTFDSYMNSSWADYDLWIILEGNGTFVAKDNISISLHPGSCLVLKPNEGYKATQNINDSLVVFHTHFDYCKFIKQLALYRNLFHFDIIKYLINNIHNSYLSSDFEKSKLWMNAILLEIKNQDSLNKITKQNNRHCTIINNMITTIHKHPEQKHKLAYYAALYNYSYDYLGRIFKDVTSTSFSQYVINVRLNKSKLLLRDNQYTIKQVSAILGYTDTCFFNKQFKKFFHLTPSTYRNNIT